MKKPIRTLTAAVILALVLAAASAVVYAYLMRSDGRENVLTVGEGKTVVSEAFTEPSYLLMRNEGDQSFDKVVTVENTGTSDQYVRVYLDFSDSTLRDKARIIYERNGSVFTADWEGFLAALPEDWEYISEAADPELGGYFYYKGLLAPGEKTTALIQGVEMSYGDPTDTDPNLISDFDLIVYTESVQNVETGTGQIYAPPAVQEPPADPGTPGDPGTPEPPAADPTPWRTAWRSFLTRTP